MTDPIVGIDLGTSNSVVAHADGLAPVKVLADDGGYKIHPSVVSFHPNGGVVVGAAAKQRKVIDPQNTIYSVKRLIGRGFRSPEVQTAKARAPYQIKEGANQLPMIVTRGGEFAVPEISAIVLDYVRNVAAARLATPVQRAVVTVPASFNDAQRSATATAGAIAGITVVRVLNEPTAAALAYGHSRQLRDIIAVYDFGGGTFDISILKLEDQVYEVLGTSGDTFLGGDDLDERLVDKMVSKFLQENRIDLRSNEVSMMRLRAVAEQTKIELSRRSRAVVRVDEIAYGPKGVPLNLQIEITRDEFVQQVSDIIDRTFPVCQEAMQIAGLSIDKINDVVLVGGTTKIPYVRDQVSKFFGKAPRTDVNPEDAVAIGAALQAASLEKILSRPRAGSRPQPAAAPAAPAIAAADVSPSPLHAPIDDEPEEPTGTDTLELADDPSGATMAPSELMLSSAGPLRPRRSTAGYAKPRPDEPKPDTSYSVTRSGARDTYDGPPPIAAFDENTATLPPQAQPLGRISRPYPAVGAPAAEAKPSQTSRTVFGVPQAGAWETATPPPPRPAPRAPVPPVPPERNDAIPPPIPKTGTARIALPPRLPGPISATHEVPTLPPPAPPPVPPPRAPNPISWSDPEEATRPAAPASPRPTDVSTGEITQIGARPHAAPPPIPPPAPPPHFAASLAPPLTGAPPPVPAASPLARTMVAAPVPILPPSAPTMFGPPPEPSPSSTARGFGPPASVIVDGIDPEPSQRSTARGYAPEPVFRPEPTGSSPLVPDGVFHPEPTGSSPLDLAAPPLRPPVVLEVTPRGLGIGTVAGYCEELIRRNSRLPAATKKLFTTSRDRQDFVRIVVCQGESRRLDQNVVIGDLVLQGLPPRPRGETSIEVTFSLDADGILHVHARDAQTGAEQTASLDLLGGMPQQDVAASRDRLAQLRR